MDESTCVVYEGDYFRIEWFFDERGFSQPYEYFLKCSDIQRRRFLVLAKRIADSGKITDVTKFKNEGDGVFAFKPQPDRYLCFFVKGKKIIVTNAFIKKSQKIPKTEKRLALKNRKIYFMMNNKEV